MRSSRRRSTPRLALGGRPTVGHVALDHGIGVRIPASQPIFSFVAFDEQVERLNVSNGDLAFCTALSEHEHQSTDHDRHKRKRSR